MVSQIESRMARGLWTLFEPVHAVSYFAPAAAAAMEDVGLRGFWRGYFAGRAAPLGVVGADVVAAAFASFATPMVARAIPAIWSTVTPEVALTARRAGAEATLTALLTAAGVDLDPAFVDRFEARAHELNCAGRVLAAANMSVPAGSTLPGRLWQAVTIVREWRGDGHIAALVAHGLAGLEVLVLRSLLDQDRSRLQQVRGWTDDDWAGAVARLEAAGLVQGGASGQISAAGRDVLTRVELATDDYSVIGEDDEMRYFAEALAPIARACIPLIPYPNPIGIADPWDPVRDPTADGMHLLPE